MQRNTLPTPPWYDKPHTEWPPAAVNFFSILLDWAERDLAAQAAARPEPQTPAPAA